MNISDFKDKEFVKQFKKSSLAHEFLVFPELLKIIGNIKEKKVLDLGCGVGDFSRKLAEADADVDAIDYSEECIRVCKEKNRHFSNVNCILGDASNLDMIKDNKYDFVVMNMVTINITSKEKLRNSFKEASRVLKKNGQFVFSDLHPICLMIPKTATEEQEYLPGFSYFQDESKYKSKVVLGNVSEQVKFIDMHWTLETYTKFLEEAGMYIYRIIEPHPIEAAPEIFKNYKIPEHIIFQCKKL